MNIEQAIQLAKDNDYKKVGGEPTLTELVNARLLFDPLFWQALGRGLGWPKYSDWEGHFTSDEEYIQEETWKYQFHRFIDHLIAGKDIESFFASLTP